MPVAIRDADRVIAVREDAKDTVRLKGDGLGTEGNTLLRAELGVVLPRLVLPKLIRLLWLPPS